MAKRDIYSENQELRILSLVEEVFRNKYKEEQNKDEKILIKKKFMEIKSEIKTNFSLYSHEYVASSYLTNISKHKLWSIPKNIFLL